MGLLWPFLFFLVAGIGGPLEEKAAFCAVRLVRLENPQATLTVLDPKVSKPFRDVLRTIKPEEGERFSLPRGRYLFLWSGPGEEASAAFVDLTDKSSFEFRFRPPELSKGVLLLRTAKTRAVHDLDLTKVRLLGAAGATEHRPLVSEDLLVFTGVPKLVDLSLKLPEGCLSAPFSARLGRLPWLFREVTLARCSDLSVTLDAFDQMRDFPLWIRVKTLESPGKPGPILRQIHLEGPQPAVFRSIPSGEYAVEAEVASRKLLQTEFVSVPLEGDLNVVIALSVVRVKGKATWGGKPASGKLLFLWQETKRQVRSEAELDGEGGYQIELPRPGDYVVMLEPKELPPGNGPGRHCKIPVGPEYTLDVSFSRALVFGRVLDSAGQPIANATVAIEAVSATSGDQSVEGSETTDTGGNYQLYYLSPGIVKLTASKSGYRPAGEVPPLRLEKDMAAEQDLILRKVESVIVTIETPTGEPAAGRFVSCASAALPVRWSDVMRTGAKGEVEIDTDQSLLCRIDVDVLG